MNHVKDVLMHISKKGISTEAEHKKSTDLLGWKRTDVLYSFRGIYTLGIYAFYKNDSIFKSKISRSTNTLKYQLDTEVRLYSEKTLSTIAANFEELNSHKEMANFITRYRSIGNIIPVWPGGNVDRGLKQIYDLPEIYFHDNSEWLKLLEEEYNAVNLKVNLFKAEHFKNLTKLLDVLDRQNYLEYLQHINCVIEKREKSISSATELLLKG